MKRVLNSSIWPFSSLFPYNFYLFTWFDVFRDGLLLCPKTPYLTPLVAQGQWQGSKGSAAGNRTKSGHRDS